VYNKNKPYITIHHTSTTKSRVLSKCDIRSSIYDNDTNIKSVKENFDRQTAQRLREYDERMKVKRQKRKAKHDKNIKEIILKDKMEKSLAEKIETGCLKCGCGLGGVAASVGLFGGLGTYGWKSVAMVEAAAKGVTKVIELVNSELGVLTLGSQPLETVLNVINYTDVSNISHLIYSEYKTACISISSATVHPEPICISVWEKSLAGLGGKFVPERDVIETTVRTIVLNAENTSGEALKGATEGVIKTSTAAIESTYASCQIAIIASVVALLIIALVMIIIYLVLRYRRKKKMNKKGQYTKLLNE
ncbi:rifin, partial [Plasmodium reichenowi]